MLWKVGKNAAITAAALAFAVPSPAIAWSDKLSAEYEQKIAEAKSLMMADSAAALKLSSEAEKLASDDSGDALKARLTAQWLQGEALMRLNRAEEAQAIIEAAIEQVRTAFPDDKLHADLLRSQASLKASSGKYGDALLAFQLAHDRYEALGDARSQAIVLQNIGSLYSDARDYVRVLNYYDRATKIFPEDNALSLSAHNNRGNALKELGRYAEAEEEFRLALGVAGKMSSPMLEARILTNIASAQFLNGQLAAAEQTVLQGTRVAVKDAPDWLPFLYGVRAQIELARGDTARARSFIGKTFAGMDLAKTSPYFRDFHETAAKIYARDGAFEIANSHLMAFNRIDGQARDLSAKANNALLGAQFDAANRELQISKLSAAQAANEASLIKANQRVWQLSGAIALAVIAIIAALLILRAVNRSRAAIKESNKKLVYVTQHDALTGLYARDHFKTLLEEEIESATQDSSTGALMFIDLDRFKQVNDVYGHAAGDFLLVEVAKRFREAAGADAVIGRLGGDEFGLFLPHPYKIEDARKIARQIIERVGEPYSSDDYELSVGASIGVCEFGDIAWSISDLMTNADLALYEAKARGRGTYVTYCRDMRNALEERTILERDLESALANGEMAISYQPIVCGKSQKVLSYEALMRWNHPTRGAVSPRTFIPIAEEALLIERLGAWLLRTACQDATNWPEDIKLSVNVSALQLSNGSFLSTVVEALAATGLAPERLLLELTESIILEMDDQVEKQINSLNELGVAFVLDDFGRGYSSLNYIEKMSFSMIKIDREFVQAATAGSAKSQAIVTAIVTLARSLDIEVTAEGIEADDQLNAMLKLGCSAFQGFYFGRPTASARDDQEQRKVA